MSRIPFTDDMHKTIIALRDKSGVGSRALINGWDEKPEGLSRNLISTWVGRRVKTVDAGLYRATVTYWESLDSVIPITPDMRKALCDEKDRTGIGGEALLNYADEDIPSGLKNTTIKGWMRGQSRTANETHYDFVMQLYSTLTPEKIYRRRYLEKDGHVELTKEIISTLKALKRDSGISTMRLLKGRKDIPKGLTSAIINRWISGDMKTARKGHFDYVVKAWQEIDKRLTLTPEMYELFHSEYARTGMTRGRFLRLFTSKDGELPKGLIDALLSGKRHTMTAQNWEFMIERFKMLPDVRK